MLSSTGNPLIVKSRRFNKFESFILEMFIEEKNVGTVSWKSFYV